MIAHQEDRDRWLERYRNQAYPYDGPRRLAAILAADVAWRPKVVRGG